MSAYAGSFVVSRGEDVQLDFTYNPVPSGGISGYTLQWRMSVAPGVTPALTKSATVVSASAGTFKVNLLAADTASLTPGVYMWEAWRTDSGSVGRVSWGLVELLREIAAS